MPENIPASPCFVGTIICFYLSTLGEDCSLNIDCFEIVTMECILHREMSQEAIHREVSQEAIHREVSPEAIHREVSPEAIHREVSPAAIHREMSPEAIQFLSNFFLFSISDSCSL